MVISSLFQATRVYRRINLDASSRVSRFIDSSSVYIYKVIRQREGKRVRLIFDQGSSAYKYIYMYISASALVAPKCANARCVVSTSTTASINKMQLQAYSVYIILYCPLYRYIYSPMYVYHV